MSITSATTKLLGPTEARVERDPETGKIVRVIHSSSVEAQRRKNPLCDPLNSDDSDVESDGMNEHEDADEEAEKQQKRGVIKLLEEQALRAAPKKERGQSEREREWIGKLVERWGDDYRAMARDRRLNPMQQTESDIKRRVGIWRQRAGGVRND